MMSSKGQVPKVKPDVAFDSTKIKHFVAMQNIDKVCAARSPNVVVGNAGSGKSLLIGVQQYPNTYYEFDPETEKHVCISTVEHPKVAHGLVAETLNMSVYTCKNGVKVSFYIDTAGFNDNRGKEEVMWTENNLDLLFSCTKQFRSIIITIDHSKTWPSSRGVNDHWVDLSKRVGALVNGREVYSSVVFAISRNFNSMGRRVSVATLKNDAEVYITTMQTQQKKKLCALYESRKQRAHIYKGPGDVNELNVNEIREYIDLSTLAPDDLKFIIDRDAGIFLMEQFQKATGENEHHVIVCTPDSEQQCEQQCAALNKKIQQCLPFTIDDGQKDSGCDTLSFTTELASIAQEDVEPLRQEKETLESLLDYKKNNSHLVQALENNWEVVRDERLKRNNTFTANREARKKVIEGDNVRLQTSTKPVLIDEETIGAARKSTLLSWVAFGGGVAKDVYTYRKGQSFIEWDDGLTKNATPTCTASRIKENRAKGELCVRFESNKGYDLNVQVTVKCYEKDHPLSVTQIQKNTEQIETIEAELQAASDLKMALKAVHSKKALEILICAEYKTLKDKRTAQVAALDQRIAKVPDLPQRVSNAQVRDGNFRLLSFMKNEGQLRLDKLCPTGETNVTEFLLLQEEVEQLQKRFGDVGSDTAVPAGDTEAPTKTNWKKKQEKLMTHCADVAVDVADRVASEFRRCSNYQLGAGGLVGSVAILFSGLGGIYGMLLGIVLACFGAVALTRAAERTTLTIAQHVAEDKEYVKALSEGVIKLVDAQGKLTQEMLDNNFQNMIEEIPKEIKVNVNLNPFGWS